MEKKIQDLLDKMTIQEKIGQLTLRGNNVFLDEYNVEIDDIRGGKVGALPSFEDTERQNEIQKIAVEESRLGIPILFCLDVIHGYRTAFPIPWAEAMSWEPSLAEKTAAAAAKEAAFNGTKLTFAPMVDICRNPSWGRICEGAGEDTYLGSRFAYARVKGFQGDDVSSDEKIAACAKHFAGYGFVEGGREYNCVDMSEAKFLNYVIPPFQACVDAGTKSVMAAFNDVNGEPCTASKWLLKETLKDKMGFDGVIVSDAFAVGSLVTHGIAKDEKAAAQKAINAGLNLEMMTLTYRENLEELVKEGSVSEETLDRVVKEVLRLKFELGLFDNPYADVNKAKEIVLCDEHTKLARDCARRSVVLLENNGVLPLDRSKKIALIGPMADSQYEALGEWFVRCHEEDCISLCMALADNPNVCYAKGCGFNEDESGFEEAVELSEKCDVVVFFGGQSQELCGEARSRANLDLPDTQLKLMKKLKETGKPLVTIISSGRSLVLDKAKEYSDALLFAGALGTMSGYAYSDILFGDYNPSAKLVSTFPQANGLGGSGYYNEYRVCRPGIEDDKWVSKFFDIPLKPLYPFGYGKSYTSFKYSNLATDKSVYKDNDKIKISVDVENTGAYDGEEIIQAYVGCIVPSNVRPDKELKGFKKVFIKSGEKCTVEIEINVSELSYYNRTIQKVLDKGEYKLCVGTSSIEFLEKRFEIE